MEPPSYPYSTNTVLGTPDPRGLAEFYLQLLGWVYRDEDHESDDTWIVIKPPGGGTGLSFQLETEHEPPTWPTSAAPSRCSSTSTSAWPTSTPRWRGPRSSAPGRPSGSPRTTCA